MAYSHGVTKSAVIGPATNLDGTVSEHSIIIANIQRRMGDLAMKVGRAAEFERIIDGLCARELVREGPEHNPAAVTVSTKDVLQRSSYDQLKQFADDISLTGNKRLSLRNVLKKHGVVVTYADPERSARHSQDPSSLSSDMEEEPAAPATPRRISGLPASTKSHGDIVMASVITAPQASQTTSGFASSRVGLAGRTAVHRSDVASAPKPRKKLPASGKLPPLNRLPSLSALPSGSASSAGRTALVAGRASAPPAQFSVSDLAVAEDVDGQLSGAVKGLQGLGTPTPDENKPKGRAARPRGSGVGEDVAMGSEAQGHSA